MLKVLSLVVLVGWTKGLIVCPPNICDTVDCASVTNDNCNGMVKQNGGFCGCCDSCITQLAEGDSCRATFLLGVPATSECASGLQCDFKTFTCKPLVEKRSTGPCATKLAEVNARLEASQHMLLGLEKPHCDANGDYLGMQFSGSQAYCVTADGTPISGYMVNRWEAGNMDCQCARDQYAYQLTGLIGKLFFCDANGNYAATPAP
ncbi:uncharacterized protein LOC127847948 isoform X2 [Dreissena polymorpha]|uniref:Thyroglobulin type-1 domain-containing protein n=1 Tax=Dreissena polymorpha TaxID=45954 RepID=A0A9D4DNM0_DREPO|nr:uncharacterized protein LOC127847948 isoform X2 [Dreissena polymorpha]KAH3751800.1 hypothetical protein DPMN_186372 [Dreissena polymorpha]